MKTETKRHLIKSLINKFTAIPSKKWCVSHFNDGHGRYCALGHLGLTEAMSDHPTDDPLPPLAVEMIDLFDDEDEITRINDNYDSEYEQRTPRARILAALHDKLKEVL